MTGDIAETPLVKRVIVAELIGAGSEGGGPAFARPRDGGTIVAGQPKGALGNVPCMDQNVLVSNHAHQFEVRDGEGTSAVVRGNEIGGDAGG